MDMKKAGITAAVILVAGFIILAATRFDVGVIDRASQTSQSSTPSGGNSDKIGRTEQPLQETAGSGSYIEYSPDILESATADDRIVLFFHAEWCPTCKALDRDITAHANNIPADTTIAKVDFDTRHQLRQRYQVRIQHTLVQVGSDGRQIAKWHHSPTLAALLQEIRE